MVQKNKRLYYEVSDIVLLVQCLILQIRARDPVFVVIQCYGTKPIKMEELLVFDSQQRRARRPQKLEVAR